MLVSDPCCRQISAYKSVIMSQRSMMSYLPADLMQRLAVKNVVKVFNLKEPKNYKN
jgi:hypothetical protein